MNAEIKEREKWFSIDANFDIKFARKIPLLFRWTLILPVGILAALAATLVFGWMATSLLKQTDNALIISIIDGIYGGLKCAISMIFMVAVAPVRHKLHCAKIISLMLASLYTWLNISVAPEGYYLSTGDMYLVITVVIVCIGLWIGISAVKEKVNKNNI